MLVTDLKTRLDAEFQKYYKVILVSGSWGIGKTYHLKKYVEDKENIYISLFGINNIDEFKYAIYEQLSEGSEKARKIIKELKNASIGIGVFSIQLSNLTKDIDECILKKINGKKLILIIDDVERKSENINTSELMGYIETISKLENLSIIVVADETKLSEDKYYSEFKEKVINKSYYIDDYSKFAVNEICTNILKKNSLRSVIRKSIFEETVISFFKNIKVKNLRTIEKAIIFATIFLKKVDTKNLKETDKIDLLRICFAVVSEDCEQRKETENSEDKIVDIIMNKYLHEDMLTGLRKYVFSVRNIYLDIDIEKNYQEISDNYLLKYNVSESEKNIFYCNEEEIKARIDNFIANNIKNFNNSINVNTWFRGFNNLYAWSKKIGYKNIFDEDELFEKMNQYSSQIDINGDFYDILDKYFISEIEDEDVRRYYDILQSKIGISYIKKCSSAIIESLEADKYEIEAFERIFNIMGRKIIPNKIIEEEIIPLICSKNFFIPNINGDITEKMWHWCHTIWERISKFDNSILAHFFYDYTQQLLNEYTVIGKYRINSLNSQYPIFTK